MHQGDLHLLAGTQRVINRRTRNNLAILYNKQSGQIITLSHNLLSIKYCFYQIEVFYSPFSEDLGSGDRGIGRLYPNVKVTPHQHHDGLSQPPPQGCGYPPSLQCVPFFEEFGAPGQNFSCFVSSMDPGVVIHSLDISEEINSSWLLSNLNIQQLFRLDLHVTGLLHPHSPLPVQPVLRLSSFCLFHHLHQRNTSINAWKLKFKIKVFCTRWKEPTKSVVTQNDVFVPQPPSSVEESLTSSSSACSLASSSSTMRLSDKKKWGPWAEWRDALTVRHYCRPSNHRMEEDRKTFRNEWVQILKNRTEQKVS